MEDYKGIKARAAAAATTTNSSTSSQFQPSSAADPGAAGSAGSRYVDTDSFAPERPEMRRHSSSSKAYGAGNNSFSPTHAYEWDLDAFESVLRQRGILRQIQATFNLIAIPLLIMAVIGVGFILVWAEEILVPFVIALFFTYLLKPLVNLLTTPLYSCTNASCFNFFRPQSCFRGAASANAYSSALPIRKNHSGELRASFDHIQVPFPDTDQADGREGTIEDTGKVTDSSLGSASGVQVELSSLMDSGASTSTSKGTESDLRSRSASRMNVSSLSGAHAHSSSSGMSSAGPAPQAIEAKAMCWRCRHFRCPRWLAILICMLIVIGFFAGIIVIIADAIQTFEAEDIEQFEERTVLLASSLKDWVQRMFGIDIAALLQEFRKGFHWVSLTQTLVFSVVNALEYVFIIFLFVLYMLFEDSEPAYGSETMRISTAQSRARDLRRQIDMQIQRYIVIKVLISLAVGVSVYVVLGPVLNVKMAHIFGLATFLCNMVPTVGAMLATLLPIPIVLLDPNQNTISMILAIALPSLVHLLLGNVIEPMIFGRTLELHAIVILVSLSFWYTVWGVAGAILSVPITAVMRIVLSHIKHPYAEVVLSLLEGKLPGSRGFHNPDRK